jgi:uncharacterized membrane protein
VGTGFYATREDTHPLGNFTLENKGSRKLWFAVDIPDNAPPANYTYVLQARLNNTDIWSQTEVTLLVKQFYDLKLILGNTVQSILADAPLQSRMLEFVLPVANKGNGNDTFDIISSPVANDDLSLVPSVVIGNTTVGAGQTREVLWRIYMPEDTSYGQHNFNVKVLSPNGDVDYSDNQGVISVLVEEPVVFEIFNFTFNDSIQMQPPKPAVGQMVTFSLPLLNTGNQAIDVLYTVNITSVSNETYESLGVVPSSRFFLNFTRTFAKPGSFNLSVIAELRSNSTGEFKFEHVTFKQFHVGYIDLAIERLVLYRENVAINPAEEELTPGESLTLMIDVVNRGDVGVYDVVVRIDVLDGNKTIWELDHEIVFLEGGGLEEVPYIVPTSNGTNTIIKAQVTSEIEYVDLNASNNQQQNTYTITSPTKDSSSSLMVLLILISVIFFMMLVFVIFLFYSKRKEVGDRDGLPTEDMDWDLDDDLEVDFIDDPDEDAKPSSSGSRTGGFAREEDDAQEDLPNDEDAPVGIGEPVEGEDPDLLTDPDEDASPLSEDDLDTLSDKQF